VETLENEITGLLPKFAKALEEYLERQRDENNEKETC
jgi:DNA topoisomerase VI subunit B